MAVKVLFEYKVPVVAWWEGVGRSQVELPASWSEGPPSWLNGYRLSFSSSLALQVEVQKIWGAVSTSGCRLIAFQIIIEGVASWYKFLRLEKLQRRISLYSKSGCSVSLLCSASAYQRPAKVVRVAATLESHGLSLVSCNTRLEKFLGGVSLSSVLHVSSVSRLCQGCSDLERYVQRFSVLEHKARKFVARSQVWCRASAS